MQFLPRLEEVPGWSLEEDPLVIPATYVAERLGTDSAHFLSYGVTDVTVGEYRRVDNRGFATLEIFRFPDFIKAFGAYSTRRSGTPLAIPNEAYLGPRSVHIWRGPFYIRVLGGGSPEAHSGLVTLAAAAAQGMPPAPSKPAVFRFFPDIYRVPNSEAFRAANGFGQPYLRTAFTSEFNVAGQPVEGLILPAASRTAAANLLNMYRQFFVLNGRLLDPVPNLGEGNFTAEDRFFGRTVAFRLDRFVIAFRGFVDKPVLIDLAIATDQRILTSIRTQLVREEQAAQAGAPGQPASSPRPRDEEE